MQFLMKLYIGFLAALAACPQALAAPTGDAIEGEAVPSAFNTTELLVDNVINASVDCTGIEELCDADCYAILCNNKEQVLTRCDEKHRKDNYRDSGAAKTPFNVNAEERKKIGVTRPGSDYTSAEEYPFESCDQGGRGASLFPAKRAMQNKQGSAIGTMYKRFKIKMGDMFKIHFNNANTPYCRALDSSDFSVCTDKDKGKGVWGFDVGEFDFVRTSLPGNRYAYAAAGKQHLLKRATEGNETVKPVELEADEH